MRWPVPTRQRELRHARAGTLPHFMGVLLEQSAGITMNHVPFQGGGPANTALLGGHIQYKFDVVSETAELHRTGKARILQSPATNATRRCPRCPRLPRRACRCAPPHGLRCTAPPICRRTR